MKIAVTYQPIEIEVSDDLMLGLAAIRDFVSERLGEMYPCCSELTWTFDTPDSQQRREVFAVIMQKANALFGRARRIERDMLGLKQDLGDMYSNIACEIHKLDGATERHLADMRALVFHNHDMPTPPQK